LDCSFSPTVRGVGLVRPPWWMHLDSSILVVMLCEQCKLIEFVPRRAGRYGQKFCSDECRYKGKLARNQKLKKGYRKRDRILCLEHYSNGCVRCSCCSEGRIEFLALDHINGGGHKERKTPGRKGSYGLWKWLIKNEYPVGYRVLCHNCNMSYGLYGYCPHYTTVKP
jgi:hypothetical protein